ADAEAADGDQLLGGVEHVGGQLGARADADEVHVGDLRLQLVAGQGGLQVRDVGVTGGLQGVDGVLVHAFQQKELDLALVERGLAHRSTCGPTKSVRKSAVTGTVEWPGGTIGGVRMLAYEPRETATPGR